MKNLSNKVLVTRLKHLNACQKSIDWIGARSLKTAWEDCPRVDWLLWLAGRSKKLAIQKLVAVACACARTSLQYVPSGEERPRLAIEAAEGWIAGRVSVEEVDAARAAARDAAGAAGAARAAARDAAGAAGAAWAARDAAGAAGAAWAAAWAARAAGAAGAAWAAGAAGAAARAAGAAGAARDAARAAAEKEYADRLREIISYEDL